MWPTMMDEPMAPGRGLPVYQPATETMFGGGTCSSPSGARPRVIRLVCTPISGMVNETGAATGLGAADCDTATIGPLGAGNAATIGPVGAGTAPTPTPPGRGRAGGGTAPTPTAAGRMAGVECRVSSRPVTPPAITTRPAASASAAAGRRVGIVRSGRSADGYAATAARR